MIISEYLLVNPSSKCIDTIYPMEYAHFYVMLSLCELYDQFLETLSHYFTNNLQGCFTGTGAILWLPQCQWSNPEGYGKSHLKLNHNKTWTLCIFLGMYCNYIKVSDYLSLSCVFNFHRWYKFLLLVSLICSKLVNEISDILLIFVCYYWYFYSYF